MLSIRDTPDLKTHTDKGGDGKSQSTQMETKGKPGQQYTYQTKQTLKQRLKRDKEGHNIITKGSIQEEDITIVSIYAPNIEAPQYIREMLTAIKGEIDSNTIIVGDFNTPLVPMDRSSRQKINKET